MLVGKTGFEPSCKQEDINALMVGLARQGKRVVRLKGSDPLFWPRRREIAACEEANIAVDVVPGITAARRCGQAWPSAHRPQTRTPGAICHRPCQRGRCLAILTGKALPTTTTAIYMPTRTLAALVTRATAEGLDPQTPALAIARATRPDQAVVIAPISELPLRVAEANLPGPVLVMLGHALGEQASARASAAPVGQKAG